MLKCCKCHTIERYEEGQPALEIESFFNGRIKGWGLVQKRSGQVLARFDMEMRASWENGVGRLEEKFTYYDGTMDERVWSITKRPDGGFEGLAGDVPGGAIGRVKGNAANLKYQMDIKVGGRTLRFSFDDWMFLMNNEVIINRIYLKKFGFKVAELTVFMQKQPAS